MAKSIKYNIFQPQNNSVQAAPNVSYYTYNESTLMTQSFTDGDVDTVWDALVATDGTGGYIGSDLVGAAIKIVNGAQTASYTINPLYNFAANTASVFDGATADPVNGKVNFGA